MAAKHDLVIDQRATFEVAFTWTGSDGNALDLSGYTAKLELRTKPTDEDAVVSVSTEEANEHGSIIAVDGPAGTVTITITDEETALLPVTSFVYDLLLEKDGRKTRLVEGKVKVTPGVTR